MSRTYIVSLKDTPELWYEVKAPTKRAARWCGFNLIRTNYRSSCTLRGIAVVRKGERSNGRSEPLRRPD